MRAWVASGVRSCFLLVVCGCADVGIEVGAASESESDGSEPELLPPDLPPQPECPAGLGEVVVCECAVVDGCSIPNAEPDNDCAFTCDTPRPCPNVTCETYLEVDGAHCDSHWGEVDAEALQCVFDALAEGQPMGWRTHVVGNNVCCLENTWNEYRRLGATTYARYAGYVFWGDGGPWEYREDSFDAFELPDSEWMDCEALADDYQRFNCLHRLGNDAEPCADPALLMCP